MFFSISKQKDTRFLNHQPLGNFYFSHDDGWDISENKFFKGYKTPNVSHGNWTEIFLSNDKDIKLTHDGLRSYPLWWDNDNKKLTNFDGNGERIWADTAVVIKNDGTLDTQKVDLPGMITNSPANSNEFVDWIVDNLSQKIKDFVNTYKNKNLKIFPTGGMDTGTLIALLKYNNKYLDVDVITYQYFYYDQFCNKNIETIRNIYWTYNQIHHWKESCFLMTGSCGDEFWFRGPYIISLWAAWHDIDLIKVLQNSKGYHVGYFLKEKNAKKIKETYDRRHEIQETYPTFESLKYQILNINANDHQHWHLNNTITWTPFKDLEITNKILSLPVDEIMDQIIDAKLNKLVISRMSPDILNGICNTKNFNDRENLDNII